MGTYTYSANIQTVTVNTAGTYDIVGYGGRGGNSSKYTGGGGAEAGGDFALTAGEKLKIVVGGQGSDNYGGGGGGTFVLGEASGATSYTLLVAAGGGGGANAGSRGAPVQRRQPLALGQVGPRPAIVHTLAPAVPGSKARVRVIER